MAVCNVTLEQLNHKIKEENSSLFMQRLKATKWLLVLPNKLNKTTVSLTSSALFCISRTPSPSASGPQAVKIEKQENLEIHDSNAKLLYAMIR